MRRVLLAGAVATTALVFAAGSATALDVGEKPPELDVTAWVQGDAVKLADGAGKSVRLVMFWGTFEADSVRAMSRMNDLFKKQKEKGFDVVAVSAEPADVVRTFLATHPVDFHVAADPLRRTLDAYGKDVRRLPWGWLVDKTGLVVWKGNPTWGLEAVLAEVLDGKFDPKRARNVENRQGELFGAFYGRDWEKLLTLAQKFLVDDPNDALSFSFCMVAFEQKDDRDAYRKFMQAHVERCKDDANALCRAADRLAFEGGYEWRDVDLALAAARRAVEASKSADANALETCGKVLYTVGLIEQAVDQQKKAVAVDDKNVDRKSVLAYYEACLAARKKATAPVPPTKKK